MYIKLKELRQTILFYQAQMRSVHLYQRAFLVDDFLLAKLAREKYYMKGDRQDIYVIR